MTALAYGPAVCKSPGMFRDSLLIASLALALALGCGGGMQGDDPAETAEDTQEGGEERAVDPDEGGETPAIEPTAEGGGGVDVNGGDVGGGSPSDD